MSPALEILFGLVVGGCGVAILASPRFAAAMLGRNRRLTARYGAAAGPGAQTPLEVKLCGVLALIIGAVPLVIGVARL